MSAEIIDLGPRLVGDGVTLEAENVLEAAKEHAERVLVVGIKADGELYVAATDGVAESVLLMERAKLWLLQNEVMRKV